MKERAPRPNIPSPENEDAPENAPKEDASLDDDTEFSEPGTHRQQKEGEPDFPDEWRENDLVSGGSLTTKDLAARAERGKKRRKRGKHSGGPQDQPQKL